MTMMKREVNNIWSRVRSDVDVDDLIFETEQLPSKMAPTVSDR